MAIDAHAYILEHFGIPKPPRTRMSFLGFPPRDSPIPAEPVERIGKTAFVVGRMFLIEYLENGGGRDDPDQT